MLELNYLEDSTLTAILQNMDLDESDESYAKVARLSKFEALDKFLTWHGIIGYTEQILKAVQSIETAEEMAEN